MILVPTLAFIFKWFNMIYTQFLIHLVFKKSKDLFRFFTCGTVDWTKFLQENLVDLKENESKTAGLTARDEMDDPIG